MGAQSKFDQHFSPAEQAKLAAWLDDNPKITATDFRDLLAERGLMVSTATAWKEKRRMEQGQDAMRRANKAMDAMAKRMEGQDKTTQGTVLLEIFKTLLFDFQIKLMDAEDEPMDARTISMLGRALSDVSRASRLNQDFAEKEREIRRDEQSRIIKAAKDGSRNPASGMAALFRMVITGMMRKPDGSATVTLTKEEADSVAGIRDLPILIEEGVNHSRPA